MAKKKAVKKKVARKKTVKKAVKKVAKKVVKAPAKKVAKKSLRSTRRPRKFNLVVRNLVFFSVLFIVSFGLYNVSNNVLYTDLFGIFAVLFGFLAIAFLIALLIYVFRGMMKR